MQEIKNFPNIKTTDMDDIIWQSICCTYSVGVLYYMLGRQECFHEQPWMFSWARLHVFTNEFEWSREWAQMLSQTIPAVLMSKLSSSLKKAKVFQPISCHFLKNKLRCPHKQAQVFSWTSSSVYSNNLQFSHQNTQIFLKKAWMFSQPHSSVLSNNLGSSPKQARSSV